ncbi:MAG: hypothetical protein HYY36_06585 [Gammaproteobacteria bacterium]|nr:hypothetical protein [Gammaproteobacteria bacterium]
MTTHSLWFEFITTVFFWAGVVVFVIGLCIMLSPRLVLRAGEVLNRWISTEKVFHDLDAPRPTERMLYHHHRIFGCFLVVGAAYILYTFVVQFEPADLSRRIVLFRSRAATEWALSSMWAINILFAWVALVLGFIVFFRPSLLKGVEATANRWFGVDDSLKRLDVQLRAPDRLFARRPRLLGALIMLGSLYIVFNLSLFV